MRRYTASIYSEVMVLHDAQKFSVLRVRILNMKVQTADLNR
jgi:hypothetical protein